MIQFFADLFVGLIGVLLLSCFGVMISRVQSFLVDVVFFVVGAIVVAVEDSLCWKNLVGSCSKR